MEKMKHMVFTGWHPMRWVRLVFGILFLAQAIQSHDWLLGIIATFFLLTAITNTGCCGANNCSISSAKSDAAESQEITFEEIKK